MLILKRFAIWVLELSCEALLFSLLLSFLGGPPYRHDFPEDLWFGAAVVVIAFLNTGYAITTALFGVLWRSPTLWVYPTITAILFVAIFQIITISQGSGWSLSTKLFFQGFGIGIVFACTFVGTYLLRKWTASQIPD